MHSKRVLAVVSALTLTGTLTFFEGDASACGGCFVPVENPSVVTDHRMILSIAKEQSTLYDQIRYTGNPAAFAWVLPISGTVEVGLSAEVVFQALDGFTQTTLIAPPLNCPPPPNCERASSFSDSASGAYADAGSPGVTVTKREVVGPYETVQLQATDAGALQNWLAQNSFSVPPDVQPVINQYVTEKFNFLALKLLPGKGVQDMRPVRVTTKGSSAVLPLRMVAAGTGPVVGISLWVLAEGRYEPQNFPSFAIRTDEIAWDWAQNRSNYTELRAQKTTASAGRGWETESSTIVYRQQLEASLRQPSYPTYPGQTTPDAGDAPLSPEERAARIDYLPVRDAQGAVVKTAVEVREADLATLFYGIPTATSRVTRLRADLAHAALSTDLVMTASQDQAVLPNVRQITKETGQPQCPIFSADGCTPIGTAPRDEAVSRASRPESFSCTTGTRAASPFWLVAGSGFAALTLARARRRRPPAEEC